MSTLRDLIASGLSQEEAVAIITREDHAAVLISKRQEVRDKLAAKLFQMEDSALIELGQIWLGDDAVADFIKSSKFLKNKLAVSPKVV